MVKPRCLYEVLGCPQDADEKAVKRAYRKAALEWHPDKNAHREEEATQRFQEIQHAYDVLKDPHERQWYDDHRDSILRGTDRASGGGGGGGGGARSGDSINLAKFFFGNAFRGYHAGPDGFYAVFHGCFTQLDELEKSAFYAAQRSKTRAAARRSKSAAKSASADGDAAYDCYARFGAEDASNDAVMEFYSSWQNFSSKRTFAFADPHNPADADGRQVRRLMEKENKAARGKARRAYNDQVRSLIDYIKRRDKRLPAAEKWFAERRRAQQAEVKAKRKATAAAEHRRRQKEMGDMLRQIRLDELEAMELEGSDDGSDGGGSGGVSVIYVPLHATRIMLTI
jgi:DnaJ family protein A protein 5